MSGFDSKFKEYLLKSILFFVIVVAGIYVGFLLIVNTGLANRLNNHSISQNDTGNQTILEIGDHFPPIGLYDVDENLNELVDSLKGHKTLLGIVSEGCDPCINFAEYVNKSQLYGKGNYQAIFWTAEVEYFSENYHITTFKLTPSMSNALEVNLYPTIIALDENLIIKFISSGYRRNFNDEYVKENF